MAIVELTCPLRLFAPAKVNLGLEVIGRRPDGYHELVTILQTISLYDVIDLVPAETLDYQPLPGIPFEEDLIWRALAVARDRLGLALHAAVRVTKRIPLSAGLGGGSSDAGTLLGALAGLAGVPREQAEGAAAPLGSDVPFFVRGGSALATGRGTELEPLPPLRIQWFVVVIPPVSVARKTAALYGELSTGDFSDGAATFAQAGRLRRGEPLDPSLMRNSFWRALQSRAGVRAAQDALRAAGATTVLPGGAGPSLFTTADSFEAARRMAESIPTAVGLTYICCNVHADLNGARIAAARAAL